MLESNATGGLEEEKEVCKLLYRRRQTFIFQHSLNPHVLPSIGCVRTFLHRWLWKQSVDRFLKRWVAYFPNKMICFLIMLPPFSLNLSIYHSYSLSLVLSHIQRTPTNSLSRLVPLHMFSVTHIVKTILHFLTKYITKQF